jgi:arylsulfatase A-like enzyme
MPSSRNPQPNLLLIVTDQQRADALSCHGGFVRTPNLDRLASSCVDLRDHFAQSPVCVPSRCTIFTGRYPQAHRCRENNTRLSAHEAHVFKILKHAGYHLGYFGKNHLLPEEQMAPNFDLYAPCDATDATPAQRAYIEFDQAALERLGTHGVHGSALFHDFKDEDTITGRIGSAAVEYLGNAPSERPWCATVCFHDPHVPHLAPRRFSELYPEDKIQLPEPPLEGLAGRHPRFAIKRRAQGGDRSTDAEKRHYLACYASQRSFVDEQIGRILDALEARGARSNTIVLFASDHGDFGWHYGMGKKDLILCDELLRVPCIVSWPGRLAPRTVAGTFTEHADLLPTLLDLAGVPSPARGPKVHPSRRCSAGPPPRTRPVPSRRSAIRTSSTLTQVTRLSLPTGSATTTNPVIC